MGTLYDKVETSHSMKVQNRSYYGTGHGWAGAVQILWNCTAQNLICESPPVTGKNYCIACKGKKRRPQFKTDNSLDEIWDGHNEEDPEIDSLYKAQRKER
jgi:hypothetical protein